MQTAASGPPDESEPSASSGPPAGAPPRAASMPLEMLVKSLAAIAAIFYVLGFLTTNSYLYLLGVSDFSLLRTRFILTGVLTFMPIVLALVGGIYAAVDVYAHNDEGPLSTRAYVWVLADIALPFALYFALFYLVADNDAMTSARDAALLSVVCAVIVLAVLSSLALYRTSERRPLSHLARRRQPFNYDRFSARFGVPDALVESMIFAVGGFLLMLAYIALFGQYFYPTIPEQLGGGRPRIAQVLIAADAVPAVRELGLEITEEAPLSAPLELLWEGEETYVIRLPHPHSRTVVQLARPLVAGVVTGQVIVPVGDPEGP
ncbi:MAG: hypothetical protein H0V00_10175 [Chloroflexia bacterium]|nr:hypothetical protein [Chloroflexia bacterium]